MLFAASQLNIAVLAVPICSPPVGEGANLKRGELSICFSLFTLSVKTIFLINFSKHFKSL